MRRRRIFKPAKTPRRMGGAFAILATAATLAVLTAALRPSDLFGSAPRTQDWRALPAEVAVVDGETLRLGDRVIRLFGVNTPPRGTPCGAVSDCGAAATAELARLTRDRALECRIHGRDNFGRGLGVCRAEGVEVNASLIAAGWGSADASAVPALGPLEASARQGRRGMWAEPSR